MLYLYQSNRLESLAELFAKIQTVRPLDDAFRAEEIVVQSQGMRRYLSSYLARENGVAANLKFSLPAGLTWRLMREMIPGIPALSPFSSEVMRWRLLDLFRSETFQTASDFAAVREALGSYLGSGESADYQLAGQLADIFDQYLVYRPEWIDSWQAGKLLDLGSDEAWQAQLWRYLDDGRQSAPHRVALWEQLLAALSSDKLPERFFVFGISTMAPMYLQLLQKVSEHCDVFIFALNPSEKYWGNVIEAAQVLKSPDDVDLTQTGHPLLASLGKQGRDFFDFLTEVGAVVEEEVFEEVSDGIEPTLLQRLQYDIQHLAMPQADEQAAQCLNDGSVRMVSAHSPLRELQVLKDHILQILHEHPDWQPHDIAVLTPNIEPYSPFIEAVFGQEQEGSQALPYSVSDVRLSRRQPLLYALEQTFSLLESRFEVDKVLPLLESRLVWERFELTADDLPLLHDTIAELNVHWGADAAMRQGGDNLFTWQQALERITLGWLLPDNDSGLWQGISAWHSDVNQLDVFSRFTDFVQTLTDIAAQWQQPATVAEWAERIRRLLAALFQTNQDDQYALQQLEQSLATWQQEAELAGFDGLLPQHTVIRHVSRFLNSESQAGFLRGGITFCSMVPMRSLPFKVLCLIGLNDGEFPRNTKAAAFDLIAKHPQKGDRARRDDDRYLFLEMLISVREILYLSYIGRDIRNDEILAPSALLSELIDTIAAMTGERGKTLLETWVKQHPLQAFSRRYFMPSEDSDGISSARQDYAQALNQHENDGKPFFIEPLEAEQPQAVVTQYQLISFWQNPVKAWLKQTLAWKEPYRDEAWEAAEPFEPPVSEKVAAAYLDARRRHLDFAEVESKLNAESLLPVGELGSLWQQKFQTAAKQIREDLLTSEKLDSQAYTLEFENITLTGSLQNVYRCGQVFYQNKTLNYPQKLAILLEHLIFNAAMPSESERKTYIVLPEETQEYQAIAPSQAWEILEKWLAYYQIGQNRPLPFFAKTGWETAAKYVHARNNWDEALKEAQKAYYGSKNSTGQADYTEVALVFGKDETAPIETPLFQNIITDLLAPLLEAAGLVEAKKESQKK